MRREERPGDLPVSSDHSTADPPQPRSGAVFVSRVMHNRPHGISGGRGRRERVRRWRAAAADQRASGPRTRRRSRPRTGRASGSAHVHPHLRTLADTVFVETTPRTLAEADLVFLALPHGASGPLAAELPDVGQGGRPRRRPPPARRGHLRALLRRSASAAPGPTDCPNSPASASRSPPAAGWPTPAATRSPSSPRWPRWSLPAWPSPTTWSSSPPAARPAPGRRPSGHCSAAR